MKLIKPDIAFDNFYDIKKYNIAKGFSAIISLVFITLCFFFYKQETEIFYYYAIASLMMIFCFSFILFSTNYKLVYYIISIGGTSLIMGASNFGSHSIHYSTFMWSLLTIVLAFFGTNKNLGKALTLIHIVGISIFMIFFFDVNLTVLNATSDFEKIGTTVEISSNVFLTAYIIYQFVIFHEYSNQTLADSNKVLEKQNLEISSKNRENIILVKEVHHRVKNNLQIIISLLRLQKRELGTDEAKESLNLSVSRIMTMSLIHEKLYQQDDLSNIKLEDYVRSLSEEIKVVYGGEAKIHIDITSNIVSASLKTMVPLGLLLNELLTNSFKYAFKNEKEGRISININPEKSDFIEMQYEDSGTWQTSTEETFGYGLIGSLVEQMDGNFERIDSKYLFKLSNPKYI